MLTTSSGDNKKISSEHHIIWSSLDEVVSTRWTRRGYLGSTLLACRAVAWPHIELEICKKSFSVE